MFCYYYHVGGAGKRDRETELQRKTDGGVGICALRRQGEHMEVRRQHSGVSSLLPPSHLGIELRLSGLH